MRYQDPRAGYWLYRYLQNNLALVKVEFYTKISLSIPTLKSSFNKGHYMLMRPFSIYNLLTTFQSSKILLIWKRFLSKNVEIFPNNESER